jgi:hypothetical protein
MYYLHCGTEGTSSQMAKQLSPREHVDLSCCTDIIESNILVCGLTVAAETFRNLWLQDVTGTKYKLSLSNTITVR